MSVLRIMVLRPLVEPIVFPVEDGASLPGWGGEHFTPYAMDVILAHLYHLDHPAPPPRPTVVDVEAERHLNRSWHETPLFPAADTRYANDQN